MRRMSINDWSSGESDDDSGCETYCMLPEKTTTDGELPQWMNVCTDVDCKAWVAKHPTQPVPSRHYHCVHPRCFSRGSRGDKPGFTCARPFEASRHVGAHGRLELKRTKETRALWEEVSKACSLLRRQVNTKYLTEFRRKLDAMDVPEGGATGDANDWSARLYLGKQGENGRALADAIERFGTLPARGIQTGAAVRYDCTEHPKPGHIVKFCKTDCGDTWYGICCGEFAQRSVLGEEGWACVIRWLDASHTGVWNGDRAVFYELTELSQPQLLESMEDWGNLLARDDDTGLYVLLLDEAKMHDALARIPANDPTLLLQTVAAEPEGCTNEDLVLFARIFRTRVEYVVGADGDPANPARCSDGSEGCDWDQPKVGRVRKKPLITRNGPVFLKPTRYTCSVHGKQVTAGAFASTDADKTNIDYCRVGDMRYETEYLVELHAAYVDTLNIAQCRRRILDRWLTTALAHVRSLASAHGRMGLRRQRLQRACRIVLAVEAYVPSTDSLTLLQLALFGELVKPHQAEYDAAVAAFDGQLVRIDGTFKFASMVMVNDPSVFKGQTKATFKKVASAVLVAVGLEGLCLRPPKLVPAENGQSIREYVTDILRDRRSVLGALSAPSGFVTDAIRQHQGALWGAVEQVYPEFACALGELRDEDGLWKQDALLMLQDIAHKEWAFTRKSAPKRHPDYDGYVACIADVFNQLRKTHNPAVHGPQAMNDKERDWRAQMNGREDRVFASVRRSVLCGEDATKEDDRVTACAMRMLGNAATTAFAAAVGTYVPRRLLRLAAGRMAMESKEVDTLFPDHGYADGIDFLSHLKGTNQFYSQVRAHAGHAGPVQMVHSLGAYQGPRKARSIGSKRRAPRPAQELQEEKVVEWEPIGSSSLVAEAIRGCEEKTTLHGLLGHKLIEGINTEECIVEAVNRHMNANTGYGVIGYDVAQMRLHYLRLKWDSAALRRILYGDKSRKRRATAQTMAVWNLARAMLGKTRGPLEIASGRLPIPHRTTPTDLIGMGYSLRCPVGVFSDEDVKTYFEACNKLNRCPGIIGRYRGVFEWMAMSEYKGAKSVTELKSFTGALYGGRKNKRRYHLPPGGPTTDARVRSTLQQYEGGSEGVDDDPSTSDIEESPQEPNEDAYFI